jgi:hypothetical protein
VPAQVAAPPPPPPPPPAPSTTTGGFLTDVFGVVQSGLGLFGQLKNTFGF